MRENVGSSQEGRLLPRFSLVVCNNGVPLKERLFPRGLILFILALNYIVVRVCHTQLRTYRSWPYFSNGCRLGIEQTIKFLAAALTTCSENQG